VLQIGADNYGAHMLPGTKGRQVMDIFIDREGVPVINKETGVVVKARPVDNPFSMQIKGSRSAMAIPTLLYGGKCDTYSNCFT